MAPRGNKCLLAIECEYDTANRVGIGHARNVEGLHTDLRTARNLFVSNTGASSVVKYLSARKRIRAGGRTGQHQHRRLHTWPDPRGVQDLPLQDCSVIQTRITATEAQGHEAALGTTQGAPPPHRRRKAPPHFSVTAQGASVGFLVLQEQERSEFAEYW
ncbi:hypothetical protein [Streptomyces buecherae]|uniref:hypothetical protein n=1 Tax=Streptomyces buecherae TaxID=2763006 RepID=UPI001C2579E3|nr:hypothetical protein [Streptomyces buecherae]